MRDRSCLSELTTYTGIDRPLLEYFDDTIKLVSRLSGLLDYRSSILEMSLIETLGINVVLLSF